FAGAVAVVSTELCEVLSMVEATVRQHRSQHDAVADLPLVTRSATVTTVEKMDRDRRPEVTAALNRWLEEYGIDNEYGPVTGPGSASNWSTPNMPTWRGGSRR
ncbi:MAG: hypothetical protein V5A55_10880, partial [Halovenus sp.]